MMIKYMMYDTMTTTIRRTYFELTTEKVLCANIFFMLWQINILAKFVCRRKGGECCINSFWFVCAALLHLAGQAGVQQP